METTPPRDTTERWSRSLRRPGDRIELARRMGLIGRSEAIQKTVVSIAQIAPTNSTVLITGETGTGKEVVARAIHEYSPRHDKPFVAVNVSALNEGTLESELFGHEKGAFTDAIRRKEGMFESAGSGTVFLDEIGDVSPALQVRLLRVLEEREFKRVGGTEILHADARVIAATNRQLEHAVRVGDFRADLYYRLRVFEIHLPPLRERKDDIEPLVEHFAERFANENSRPVPQISDDAMDMFLAYDWPGNIRELRTVVERMIVTGQRDYVTTDDVPDVLRSRVESSRLLPTVSQQPSTQRHEMEIIYRTLLELRAEVHDLRRLVADRLNEETVGGWIHDHSPTRAPQESSGHRVVDIEVDDDIADDGESTSAPMKGTIKELEREAIRQTLDKVGGNRREAAKSLGIGERTLYRKLKEYDLS